MNQVELKKRRVELGSYILEMICLLVVGNMLGENGIAYFAVAFECFLFFQLIFTYKMTDTLGRLIRNRTAKGQYKNAKKFKKNILSVGFLTGVIGSVALFALAEILGEKLFHIPYSTAMIRILAPVVFLRTIVSILLGYFQGDGTELPAVIAYILRQICIWGFAILFVKLLSGYGNKVAALFRQENFAAMYAGMGLALAVLTAEILVFLFLAFVYQGSRRRSKKGQNDGMRVMETFPIQMRAVMTNLFPLVLVGILSHLPVWAGILFYQKSLTDMELIREYGVFYGKFLPVVIIACLLAWLMLLYNCYEVLDNSRSNVGHDTKGSFGAGFHMSVVFGLFVSVFVGVMAPQIADLAGGESVDLTVKMLQAGSAFILFSIVGYYCAEILLLINNRFLVAGIAAGKSVVFILALAVLLNNGVGVLALVYAALGAQALFAVATVLFTCRQLRCGIDTVRQIAIPLGIACVIGVIMWLISKGLAPHVGSVIAILLNLLVGFICDGLALLFFRNFKEQELSSTFIGRFLRSIGQALRLY